MKEILPVASLTAGIVFLFVIYLTGALDLSITAAITVAALLLKFQSAWLFISSLAVFTFYLVSLFLSLKIKFVSDLSVSSYFLFAAGLILYFLEGQKSKWELKIPFLDKITVKKDNLIKAGGILLFVLLIFPLGGPHFAAIFGYLAFLYLFKKSDGRYAFAVALFFLILCPFLLIAKKDKIAEQSAIFTYYFLVLGTVQEIIGLIINPLPDEDEIDQEFQITTAGGFIKLHSQKVREARLQLMNRQNNKIRNRRILIISSVVLISSILAFTGFYFAPRFKISYLSFQKVTPSPTTLPAPTVTPTPTLTPEALEETLKGKKETLNIQVLNGTNVSGLAASVSAQLKTAGFVNIDIGNSPQNYDNWQANLKEKDDNLMRYLTGLLDLNQLTVQEASQGAKFDLEIIIGSNR